MALVGAALVMALLVGVCSAEAGSPRPRAANSTEFPAAVLQELQDRGCKLPGKKSKGAIIQGEFIRRGQSDWAALCATKMSTSLLVFPDGSREGVEVLETRPKGFSKWSISVGREESLNRMRSASEELGQGASGRFEIDHQAIYSFVEFGDKDGHCLYCYSAEGRIYYRHQEHWINLRTSIVN